MISESFKGFTISKKNIKRRLIPNNQDLLNQFKDQNIILIGGHYNNWEICGQGLPLYFDHKMYAIYKPLSNQFFDKLSSIDLLFNYGKKSKKILLSNNSTKNEYLKF